MSTYVVLQYGEAIGRVDEGTLAMWALTGYGRMHALDFIAVDELPLIDIYPRQPWMASCHVNRYGEAVQLDLVQTPNRLAQLPGTIADRYGTGYYCAFGWTEDEARAALHELLLSTHRRRS